MHFDDRNNSYIWYVDYLYPSGEKPFFKAETIKEFLRHGYILEDQYTHLFDVHITNISKMMIILISIIMITMSLF